MTTSFLPPGMHDALRGAADAGVASSASYATGGLSTAAASSGLLGSAPEVAASIHLKPEGFVLVAVADGLLVYFWDRIFKRPG